MPTSTDPDLTPDYALVLELAGASVAMPLDEFEAYAIKRLAPLLPTENREYLTDVLILSATMTGGAIQSWAEDTNREPDEIFRAIRVEFNNQTDE